MRHLTAEEAVQLGVLQEVNRRLLHPRGLALEGTVGPEPGSVIFRIQDHRGSDDEGVRYSKRDLRKHGQRKQAAFDALIAPEREEGLGYLEQPLS